jgi:large repetitive protein
MALQPKDPSAAVITSVGGSATGGSISSTTPVITGTADAGDVVSIYDGVRLLGTAVVAANGTWSFTPTTPLKTGNHSFAAIPVDSQGNHGASSNVVTAAIGSSAPATPATPTVTDDTGHTIPAGGTTADDTPTFSGTGTAGDTITVYDNGTAIGSTTIAGDGTWSWTPTTPLPSGDNSIVVIETNPAGTPSSGSTPIHVVVDTSVPSQTATTASR